MVAVKKAKKKPSVAQLRKQFEEATKLWQILKIALHDFKIAEESKKFSINMGLWVADVVEAKKCYVCLAGSVMAGRYWSVCKDTAQWRAVVPEQFADYDAATQKFYALNELRVGRVGEAAHELFSTDDYAQRCKIRIVCVDGKCPYKKYHKLDRRVCCYEDSRTRWWADMRKLLADLKEADL